MWPACTATVAAGRPTSTPSKLSASRLASTGLSRCARTRYLACGKPSASPVCCTHTAGTHAAAVKVYATKNVRNNLPWQTKTDTGYEAGNIEQSQDWEAASVEPSKSGPSNGKNPAICGWIRGGNGLSFCQGIILACPCNNLAWGYWKLQSIGKAP